MDPEDSLVDATHHDVAHAATIGTGPVDLARGTDGSGSGADEYTMPRAEASTALTAGELVGEYRIERKIGEGGMGVVYGAVHPLIGKRAAIKVLNKALCMQPEAVERFVTEARAANQIGHPNIVDVFAFGNLSDGRSYFVMEWLDGKSLAERLRKGLPPLAETIAILDEVEDAVGADPIEAAVGEDAEALVEGADVELHVLDPLIGGLLVRDAGHLLGAVEPVDPPRGGREPEGKGAGAATYVQHLAARLHEGAGDLDLAIEGVRPLYRLRGVLFGDAIPEVDVDGHGACLCPRRAP